MEKTHEQESHRTNCSTNADQHEIKTIISDILENSRPVTELEKLNRIGEGTFGVVYRALDPKTQQIVALKRIRTVKKEEITTNTIREIAILSKCHHENVIKLNEVLLGEKWGRFSIFLSLEYCERDLSAFLDDNSDAIDESHVKCMVHQLLHGLKYLHSMNVIHRDLNLGNLLLNNSGCLKIGDFGLARLLTDVVTSVTPQVVTLWYRAPEILLGSTNHSFAIDLWAFGCIFAELLQRKPLFAGNTEISQLGLITELIGTPSVEQWPELNELTCSANFSFTTQPENKLNQKFSNLSDAGIELLTNVFIYNPKKRFTAETCLSSSYFFNDPQPCDRIDLIHLTAATSNAVNQSMPISSVQQTPPLPPGVSYEAISDFLQSLNKKPRLD